MNFRVGDITRATTLVGDDELAFVEQVIYKYAPELIYIYLLSGMRVEIAARK